MRPDIQTLDDLIGFAKAANLPLDDMRFALGRDMGTQPKWFYIYREPNTGSWVVAKNKADGKAAIRYYGDDETEAVRIILDKMESEANARGLTIYPDGRSEYTPPPSKPRRTRTPVSNPMPSPGPYPDIDPWDVPENRENTSNPTRRRRRRTNTARNIILVGLVVVAMLLTAGLTIAISNAGNIGRPSGRRPSYDESYDVPAPEYHWYFDFGPSYDDGYRDYRWNDPYEYDYGHDYNYDYDYDSDWYYDDDDWDSGYDDWDWDDSDWDSDWDSGWDSWDSGDSDWDSDW